MKEETKDTRAMEYFTNLAKTANNCEMIETSFNIAGNDYKATVDTFNLITTVWEVIDNFNSIEIGTI